MGPCRWGQVAIAAILLSAPLARADSLADARKAVETSDYLSAEPALKDALKAGTASPAELAEIYKLSGIVDAALGNAQGAQTAFAKWLALEPKASLPSSSSPKIMRPFSAAQDQAKKRGPLEVKVETKDNPPAVTLVVVNDPMKMIAGAKVYFRSDRKHEETLSAEGGKRITIELGTGKRIDLRLHAVDEYGNRAAELGSKDVPIVITSSGTVVDENDRNLLKRKKPTPTEPERPRSWYWQWWLWGLAAGVATVTGGVFAYRTYEDIKEINYLHANSLSHPWSDEQAVESRARVDLMATNIAAGTAGAFAVGALILYITRPHTESAVQTTIAPTPHGATVVVGGQF
jgi:hypothetical protein